MVSFTNSVRLDKKNASAFYNIGINEYNMNEYNMNEYSMNEYNMNEYNMNEYNIK